VAYNKQKFNSTLLEPWLHTWIVIWKWTADGNYSAQSCYKATFQGSILSKAWKLIWKNWVPSKITAGQRLALLAEEAKTATPPSLPPL
jgi:hypothetical protein